MEKFREWLHFRESVTVRVADYDEKQPPKDISELGYAVKTQLHRTVPEFNQGTNPEGFTIDGLDVSAQQGVMNFYPAGIPDAAIPKILKAIKYFLGEHGVKFGEFKEDQSGMFRGEKVYRIPVQITQQPKNAPPDINMANETAQVIFHGLLNLPINQKSISATDLLFRLSTLTDFNIQKAIQKPSTTQKPGQAQFVSFGIDESRIRRHIEALRQLAQWCVDNHYDTIELV